MYDAVTSTAASRRFQVTSRPEPDPPAARTAPAFARNPMDALSEALSESALGAANAAGPVSADPLSEALSDVLAKTASDVVKAPPAPEPPGSSRPDLGQVLRDYQVRDDEMVDWTPNLGPFPIDVPGADSKKMTRTEAALLDKLATDKGLLGLKKFQEITSNDPEHPGLAYRTADRYFPRVDAQGNRIPGGDDGHNDAFRHAYWNALMAKHFGEDFAAAFASAHEGVPGNAADREAMDLHNNELGRRIAREHPDASDEELAKLVSEAVQGGEAVVIDGGGELAWSDQVAVGRTGTADDPPAAGGAAPPDYSGS
ncbi:MAG TPA: hypothetical protein VM899_08100 [Rubellimicrobium sp.]|jgi:hypothetical protein|nr:hypothetical protein [Rubellimicrobium sp.]